MHICGCSIFERRTFSSTDQFVIPDLATGGMENWGLITYRETALLYDNETNPASSKQGVAKLIAHELAHQVRGPGKELLVSFRRHLPPPTHQLL